MDASGVVEILEAVDAHGNVSERLQLATEVAGKAALTPLGRDVLEVLRLGLAAREAKDAEEASRPEQTDATDFLRALEGIAEGNPQDGDYWCNLWRRVGGAEWEMTDYGRDVLAVFRLGMQAREKQAEEPTLQEIASRAVRAATELHGTFHTHGEDATGYSVSCCPEPRRLVTPPCPKCGGETLPRWAPFVEGEVGYGPDVRGGDAGLMEASCESCYYTWPVPALDEQDAQP